MDFLKHQRAIIFDKQWLSNLFGKRRIQALAASVAVLLSLCLYLTLEIHNGRGPHNQAGKGEDKKKDLPTPPSYLSAHKSTSNERFAYVTFLAETDYQGDDLEQDHYFNAVRILVWQLKHKPETRTEYDVVVITAPNVSQTRKDRLKKDGAIVRPVKSIHTEHDEWLHSKHHIFSDVMTKLRVFEMVEYDRVLMIDGDSMVRSSLDGIFKEAETQLLRTNKTAIEDTLPRVKEFYNYNETIPEPGPLPDTYLLAALHEVWDSSHEFPPKVGTGLKDYGNFNAGFFLLAPSLEMFAYYKSLMDIRKVFDPVFPEQNLMNYAHRWNGPMPWREMNNRWNIRYPTENDFEQGVVSVHEKWWKQEYIYGNDKVKEWLKGQRYVMKGWYDAWDLRESE